MLNARDNPVFLDVLARLVRRDLVEADVRQTFALYGTTMVATSALYLQVVGREGTQAEAVARAERDHEEVRAALAETSPRSLLARLGEDALPSVDRSPLPTTEPPPGLAFVLALLAVHHQGAAPLGDAQRTILEAIAHHATRHRDGLLASEPERVTRGTVLMESGEEASEVLLLLDGELTVHDGHRRLGRRLAGSVVGEMALVSGGTRSATVRVASRDARVLRLSPEAFQGLFADRVFLSAYAETVARRSNHATIGDVEQRRRLDGLRLEDIASDRDALKRQRVAFETLVRRRHRQGNSWAPAGAPHPDATQAAAYLDERVRLGRLLAWELGLDALAIQYAPDFQGDLKQADGRVSALTRADTMGQLKLMLFVRDKFGETDTVVGEEDVGGELFASDGRYDYRWYVDPIDGTRTFAEGGDEWGVHVFCEFRVERGATPDQDQWVPLLCVKFTPSWNEFDDAPGGPMATWHQQGPITMNGRPFGPEERAARAASRKGDRIRVGSHPRLPFIASLPADRFELHGRYRSGLVQSLRFDLGDIDLLSIGSPVGNRTRPHDAFVAFSALGFGADIGVFDFALDENGRPGPAVGGMDEAGLARTVVGAEGDVAAFLEVVLAPAG